MLLEALVQDKLCYLDIGMSECPVFIEFLKCRGSVSSLETLVWGGNRLIPPPIAFLQANPQITTLALPSSIIRSTLSERIIPLLSKWFSNLSSLYLTWEGVFIPESDLDMISCINTLKQIHLSAGDQHGGHHDWIIDHKSLQQYLGRLPLLQTMAFSRDGYDNDFSSEEFGWYYSNGRTYGVGNEQENEWERGHRQRMLDEAKKYVSVMPSLKWLYFGEIEMGVKTTDEENARTAYCLEPEIRESKWSLLRKMFGCSTSFDCS